MSVIVRRESDGQVINFIKGADVAIRPLIRAGAKDGLVVYTFNILNRFAAEGLRTLCFGSRVMDNGCTKESLKDMSDSELEKDIELLGATGLEDLLQEDVS